MEQTPPNVGYRSTRSLKMKKEEDCQDTKASRISFRRYRFYI